LICKIKIEHFKSSSHSRRSDDERNRVGSSSRTVIYEEPSSSTSHKTLKSSVRQVVQTSSFYNTSTTNKPTQSKPLTVGSGKQSRAINSDLYHSEIVDDEDEDDNDKDKEEGEMDYSSDQQQQINRRSKS
jgi:hypothetical protein